MAMGENSVFFYGRLVILLLTLEKATSAILKLIWLYSLLQRRREEQLA